MEDKPRFFDLHDQPPVIQLFTTVIIVVIGGSLLFYMFVFAGSLIFDRGISEILSLPPADAGRKDQSVLKYLQVSQQLSLFLMPALVTGLLLGGKKRSFLMTGNSPGSVQVLLVILLAISIFPVTSYTGMLNSRMNLPGWLSGIEKWMQMKEDAASDLTTLILGQHMRGDLLINILVMAVIPAVAEEFIFRGTLQQILCRLFRSDHTGIWITAILFSAIHLQFFGFIPRLILGLCFGYLFFWTRNLWLPVTAHFINNLVPVVISYFLGWKELNDKTSSFTEDKVTLPLFAALLSAVIFYYFRSEYRKGLSPLAKGQETDT